jgi:hypothetical protein
MLHADQIARYAAERDRFLYHVTDAERVVMILREGLRPDPPEHTFAERLIRSDCVYLCNRWVAEGPGQADFEWGDAILTVDLQTLDPAHFVADEEDWRGLGSDGKPESDWNCWPPQDALALLALFPQMDSPDALEAVLWQNAATVAYRGVIPASALAVHLLPARPDLPELDRLR